MSNPVFAKNLPNGKNHLYGLIIEFLRYYHSGGNLHFRIREMWIDIHVLSGKGLKKQAEKKLDKALQLAKDHSLFTAYVDFSRLKRKMARNFHHDKKQDVVLKGLSEEARLQYSKLGAHLDILDLYEKVFLAARDQKFDNEEWEATIRVYRNKLEALDTKGQSLEDVLFYFTPLMSYYNRKQKYHSSLEIYEGALKVLEKDPSIIKEDASRFVIFLNNYFNVCIFLKDVDRMKDIIARMERLKPMTLEDKAAFPAYVLYARLNMLVIAEKYDQVIPLAPELERVFLSSAPTTKSRRWAVCTNTGTAFMLAGDYEGALFWFNVPAQDPEPAFLPIVQYVTRMCLLICHKAMKNDDLLESLERSLARFIRKQPEQLKETMKKPFRALQEYLYAKDKERRVSALEKLITTTTHEPAMSALTLWATKRLSSPVP
ncbi:MAG: hypothetical protein KF852_13500 [Saprospiraceae bacterium]|nr:hypothetical protein [Saprospiraceae bacterium]